ncbi:MAG: hypothetical protein AABX03_01680 [Nanoarchaeota archaeon]
MVEQIIDKSALPEDHRDSYDLRIDLDTRIPLLLGKLNITKPSGSNAVRISVENGLFSDSYIFNIRYGLANGKDFISLGETMRYTSECLPFPKFLGM